MSAAADAAMLSESVEDCCPAVLLPHDVSSSAIADNANSFDMVFIILSCFKFYKLGYIFKFIPPFLEFCILKLDNNLSLVIEIIIIIRTDALRKDTRAVIIIILQEKITIPVKNLIALPVNDKQTFGFTVNDSPAVAEPAQISHTAIDCDGLRLRRSVNLIAGLVFVSEVCILRRSTILLCTGIAC